MFSPFVVQIAVALLAVFSVGGVLAAAFYPRLTGGTKSEKRLEAIAATKRKVAADRLATEEGRRRRSVEDTLKELEETQKAKARKSQKPTLTNRMRQAGLGWTKNTYYLICVGAAFGTFAFAVIGMGFGLIPSAGFAMSGGVLLPHFFVNLKRKRRLKKFHPGVPQRRRCHRARRQGGPSPGRLPQDHRGGSAGAGRLRVPGNRRGPDAGPAHGGGGQPAAGAHSAGGGKLFRHRDRDPVAHRRQPRGGLTNLSKVLRDRKKMSGKIRAMSAEAKSSAGIIGSLPIVVAILVYITSPDYILLLFQTTVGNIVLAICGMWMLMGILVMRKMINFDY